MDGDVLAGHGRDLGQGALRSDEHVEGDPVGRRLVHARQVRDHLAIGLELLLEVLDPDVEFGEIEQGVHPEDRASEPDVLPQPVLLVLGQDPEDRRVQPGQRGFLPRGRGWSAEVAQALEQVGRGRNVGLAPCIGGELARERIHRREQVVEDLGRQGGLAEPDPVEGGLEDVAGLGDRVRAEDPRHALEGVDRAEGGVDHVGVEFPLSELPVEGLEVAREGLDDLLGLGHELLDVAIPRGHA